jgi:transcriptional regulator with XRE-family HTH domain
MCNEWHEEHIWEEIRTVDAHEDDPRRLLGDLLRQARTDAMLSQESLGVAVGVDRSGIARMEAGQRQLTSMSLTAWLGKCDVTGLSESGIRAMWRAARRQAREPAERLLSWTDAEADARVLRFWHPGAVPGLLQVEAYAYETFRVYGYDHDSATQAAALRMERHRILDREKPPRVVAIIDEPVLYRQLGSREVMAGQCRWLLELTDRPQVSVQVVRGASAGLGGMVALAEGPGGTVVLAGSVLEDIVTDDDGQVQAADAILDAVRGVAENTAGSRNIIGEALKRWTE